MVTFQELLKAQCGISLDEGYTIVKNIAPQAPINHVHTAMHTTTHTNHSITKDMVKERISVYSERLNQSNASEYFMRNNVKHCDPNTMIQTRDRTRTYHFLTRSRKVTRGM